MISEIHQIYWGGGQWYLSPTKLLGGSMTSEPHQYIGGLNDIWARSKILGGGGAQWYLSPTKILGRLNDIQAPPHIGGGGAQWYPRSTHNIGGGAEWYLGPTKNMGGGAHWYLSLPKYFFGLNDMRDPMSEPPPPLPKWISINCLYFNGKSVDYRYTWVSCLEYNDWGGGGLMISEPRNKYWGRLNDIWAPLKILGLNVSEPLRAQWYLSPTQKLGGLMISISPAKNIGGGGGSMISEPPNIFIGGLPPPPPPQAPRFLSLCIMYTKSITIRN